MNLKSFQSQINETILDRGHDYYIDGKVVGASTSENEFLFYIEGNDQYEVLVKIDDNGEIICSGCSCPYDFGPVCKHEVAAYFQINEDVNQLAKAKKKLPNTPQIKDVLSSLSKEQLMDILADLADQDEALENSLIVKYSQGDHDQIVTLCKKQIRSIVKKYKGRDGFINYWSAGKFTAEMGDVLQKAESAASPLLGTDIALLVMDEAIYAFQYADDSDGDIGDLIAEAQSVIEVIAADLETGSSHRQEIFTKLLAHTDKKIFDGWEDFKIALLNICFLFADDEVFREKLKNKVEDSLRNDADNDYLKYTNESLLQLLYQLIEEYGTEEEGMEFIQDHMHLSSFKEQLLEKYLKQEDYQKVIDVSFEGEEKDQQYPGLVSRWKKYRYKAYKSLSLKKEQEQLGRELLLGGDFSYYHDLKELAAADHKGFYTHLKKEWKTSKGWYSQQLLLQLIEEENDTVALLEFVRDNPRYIEEYAGKLEKDYKEEVIEIYTKYILEEAKSASNRSNYREVCRKLNRFKKVAGKPQQVGVIEALMDLYKRKPAFLDELGKIR
ncbi:SWIM zinc finger family protein [Bacillus salacetis]|uniref:SWIM zinc finger family protein n=1 Tax=Bacillus salacetis TaxID=2315464 RepID=UPI003B9EFCC3